MKKTVCILAAMLAAVLTGTVSADENLASFVSKDKVWHYNKCTHHHMPDERLDVEEGHLLMFTPDDTLINHTAYSVLAHLSPDSNAVDTLAFMREEDGRLFVILNHPIFEQMGREVPPGTEIMAFDFNAEAGHSYQGIVIGDIMERGNVFVNSVGSTTVDGTVFRTPICIDAIKPVVKNWKKPITIARHAYGDVYKNVEIRAAGAGVAKLVFEGADGDRQEVVVHEFKGPGVLQGMHNTDRSITSFAHSCFKFAIDTKQDVWFSTKDTISKKYDARFREIFDEVFEQYKSDFERLGLEYFYTLIDDAVARVIRSEGGFIWACKNYDGDVMSDMVSTAFGSLAMMTSVLVSPDGKYEYEAAHGTVTRHYYKHLKGEETSTNSMATIFAWTGALRKRGELDGLPELVRFACQLEDACFDTLNEGIVTKDLVSLMHGVEPRAVNSREFLLEIRKRLEKRLGA